MAGRGARSLHEAMRALRVSATPTPSRQTLPSLSSRILPLASESRTMATASAPTPSLTSTSPSAGLGSASTTSTTSATTTTGATTTATATPPPPSPLWIPPTTVPVTIYSFPTLEPTSVEAWSTKHLHLPLRRDILHLAVIYEGDKTRQGTASTKTPWEVHGSHRKQRPQKGTGNARLGWKQSPAIKGGGRIHGPKPRDFSTRLNRKVYDLAWRTALSYRYRRGELFVTEDGLDLPLPADFLALAAEGKLDRELEDGYVARTVREVLAPLGWGRSGGRSTFIVSDARPSLFTSLGVAGREARALEVADVDVKDLLETGRIVIERSALERILEEHQSDLSSRVFINGRRVTGPPPRSGVLVP